MIECYLIVYVFYFKGSLEDKVASLMSAPRVPCTLKSDFERILRVKNLNLRIRNCGEESIKKNQKNRKLPSSAYLKVGTHTCFTNPGRNHEYPCRSHSND